MQASRHSRALSSESLATFSTSNTATSASTIWGPGTLSGKAIEAFGEATLRGVENVVIRRKLATYRSLFPHTDDTIINDIGSIYENVLEFSRPMVYSKNTTQAALRLIMTQIASRETYHLRKGLERWPMVELKFFLSQIMNAPMHAYENWGNSVSGRGNVPTSRDESDLISIVDFMALIADHDDSACQAAFDGGFLDILLRIYAVFPKFGRGRSALFSACTSALLVLSRQPEHLEKIIYHPVCTLWTTCGKLFQMLDVVDDSFSSRHSAWRRTGKVCVMSRLVTIYKFLLSTSRLKAAAAVDMCTDLVEFSRSLFHDSEVVDLAILAIFKCILVGGEYTRHLVTALTSVSYQDAVSIFSGVIRLWLAYIQNRNSHDKSLGVEVSNIIHGPVFFRPVIPTEYLDKAAVRESFYIRQRNLLFWKIKTTQRRIFPLDDRPLHNIINFVIAAAKHSMTVRWAILDAGILALVPLVFVDGIVSLLPELLNALGQQSNGDYILPPQRGHGSRIEIDSHELDATIMPLALINAEASVLVRCIQAPQFRELLCSEMFVTRRSICSSLLDTFLGGDCGVDGRYSDTRKLFAQILAEGNISLIKLSQLGKQESIVEPSIWQPFLSSTADCVSLSV